MARSLLLFGSTSDSVTWRAGSRDEANDLLASEHYLGPTKRARYVLVGVVGSEVVAAQVWSLPTSRRLPTNGTWLELSRWCLTPDAGKNAGSRMHGFACRWLRENDAKARTLVSYSDPSAGHTGALYRACNWQWSPTWHRLRTPPSGNGTWNGDKVQSVKDRWIFALRPDASREEILSVTDEAAVRCFASAAAKPHETRWLAARAEVAA